SWSRLVFLDFDLVHQLPDLPLTLLLRHQRLVLLLGQVPAYGVLDQAARPARVEPESRPGSTALMEDALPGRPASACSRYPRQGEGRADKSPRDAKLISQRGLDEGDHPEGHMPLYFFHLNFVHRVLPDEEGVELPNRSAAREEALAVVRDLADPKIGGNTRRWASWFLQGADDEGQFFRTPIGHPVLEIVGPDAPELQT